MVLRVNVNYLCVSMSFRQVFGGEGGLQHRPFWNNTDVFKVTTRDSLHCLLWKLAAVVQGMYEGYYRPCHLTLPPLMLPTPLIPVLS